MIYTWSYVDELINSAFKTIDRDACCRWKRDDERSGWTLSLVLAGVKKEDIEISLDGGSARIGHPNGALRVHIPKAADAERMDARLELGILELFVPDARTEGRKKIEVK